MILPEEIGYECELQENISLEDLREVYKEGVIIWLNGSGASPDGKSGSYRCVLEYKGHTKYIENQVPNGTTNQSMLMGAIEAVKCVNKPLRIYLISPTALGFAKGFKGKGPNGALVQQLCEIIKEKDCFLTEVQFVNGGASIKKFVYSCNSNKEEVAQYRKTQEERGNWYKEKIYRECLLKVEKVLVNRDVDNSIIDEIRRIRP